MTDATSRNWSIGGLGGVSSGGADDAALQAELVEKYVALRPALLSYAQQVLRNMAEAEDVVQVAFMKLFDARQKKEPITNLRAWLYRVAHNLAIDQLRKKTKQSVLSAEWQLRIRQQKVEENVEQKMIEGQTLAGIFSRLNDREKHCLLLRAEGLSYEEIASVVGISAKAVSVYLVRGLKKAREEA